jgi:protein TonB
MFDRYVAQTKPSWKRRALIIASIALHVTAAMVLVVWSFVHVDEIAPPALSLTFFSAPPPPPPPPPPPAAHHKSTPHKVQPTKVVQPTEVPKIVQPQEQPKPEEKDDSQDDGQQGGVKGGVAGGTVGGTVGGVKGGVLGGTLGGNGTDLNAKPAKMVAGFTLIASQLSHPNPQLPEWFKNAHPQQTVKGMYKVCLRNDGHVGSVYAMTSITGLDAVIIQQIKAGWLYKPQPVPVCFPAVLRFEIK